MDEFRTSYPYLQSLIRTQEDIAQKQIEFTDFVRNKLRSIGRISHFSYVMPVRLEMIPYTNVRNLLALCPDNLLSLETDRESDSQIIPFEIITGEIDSGVWFAAEALCSQHPTASPQEFVDYLRTLSFPIDKIRKH